MKKITGTILLIFILNLCFPSHSYAQAGDFEAGLFNVGIGSVLGGVGAVINKKPGQNFRNVLLKGMGQGALGGYVVFESKRLVREFAKSGDFGYVWPSKIVNSAGTSIIENAAANRNFWERWHFNIGFNRFEIHTAKEFKFRYRIMPFALAATASGFVDGKFHPKYSLRMGTFVFTTSEIDHDSSIYGQSRFNSIMILNDHNGRMSLPHELIHNFQYERLSGINPFLEKPEKEIAKKLGLTKLRKTYNKIFYTDYNAFLHSGLYWLANPGTEEQWKNNFFEHEAEYYSDTQPRQNYLGF